MPCSQGMLLCARCSGDSSQCCSQGSLFSSVWIALRSSLSWQTGEQTWGQTLTEGEENENQVVADTNTSVSNTVFVYGTSRLRGFGKCVKILSKYLNIEK